MIIEQFNQSEHTGVVHSEYAHTCGLGSTMFSVHLADFIVLGLKRLQVFVGEPDGGFGAFLGRFTRTRRKNIFHQLEYLLRSLHGVRVRLAVINARHHGERIPGVFESVHERFDTVGVGF